MKKQIKRLSPHQNGKVFGITMAVIAPLFMIPLSIIMFISMPTADKSGNPINSPKFLIIAMPIFYLVFGYISTAIGFNFTVGPV
ncbi:MAG: hypothetical protein M0Z89_03930 [Nitrospiraceae bacterium]|nr:hypothetical protein [Nitrospiraceae bacterium]